MTEMNGKERMLADWEHVLTALLRADNGEFEVKHIRDEDGGVIGVNGELMLQFNYALDPSFQKDSAKAIELAKAEADAYPTEEGTINAKQKFIVDWFSVRNSIVRSESGEMKVTMHNNKVPGGGIVGAMVEWSLQFGDVVGQLVSDEDKATIDEAQKDEEE